MNVNNTGQIKCHLERLSKMAQSIVGCINYNKTLNLTTVSEVLAGTDRLAAISSDMEHIKLLCDNNAPGPINTDEAYSILTSIHSALLKLAQKYGATSLDDLVYLFFNPSPSETSCEKSADAVQAEITAPFTLAELNKYNTIRSAFHPVQCVEIAHTPLAKKTPAGKSASTKSTMTCVDLTGTSKSFELKTFGIKLTIQHPATGRELTVTGIVDNVLMKFVRDTNPYIKLCDALFTDEAVRLATTTATTATSNHALVSAARSKGKMFIDAMTLRDYFVCSTPAKFARLYDDYNKQLAGFAKKTISQAVDEFVNSGLQSKRTILINLLVDDANCENKYLAYLLYDMLSSEPNTGTDDRNNMFNSFSWHIKERYRDATTHTLEYTNKLYNVDITNVPLEQQICLLNTSDVNKEKAMVKLKDCKSKSDDNSSKSRQYVEGFLRIPFNRFKKEPILCEMQLARAHFERIGRDPLLSNVLAFVQVQTADGGEPPTDRAYTVCEISTHATRMRAWLIRLGDLAGAVRGVTAKTSGEYTRATIIRLIDEMNSAVNLTGADAANSLEYLEADKKARLIKRIDSFFEKRDGDYFIPMSGAAVSIETEILARLSNISMFSHNISDVLNQSVHGHESAKTQIKKIMGQWISGTHDGYCFGFEGPPGVGKTTLAKLGLAKCLLDERGEARPFSMIPIGGSSSGSTLVGHNYTYVGSSWGSIVQIIMDANCLNPIIFIDELDKISNTEHGREIVGILTHMLDRTQNSEFHDNYFNGIHIDLSKALFVLSYNDPSLIDSVLLDRIHRIRFNALSTEDKVVISNTHLLPEIYAKMGLTGAIVFPDNVIRAIIDQYTSESGVRKLKEIFFEIVGEINLSLLAGLGNNADADANRSGPIQITEDDVRLVYMKDRSEITMRPVSRHSAVGRVNGMYATAGGSGGTLPIQCMFFPANSFLELKLTGLQKEVMRESMHISLTLAWNLSSADKQKQIRERYDSSDNKCGINIHTGDGSCPKDGPSGGCAITVALYSLLHGIPVKPQFGITGEIQLNGAISEIGGLDHKILGAIREGVTGFVYPKENQRDCDALIKKYADTDKLANISFYPVQHIEEALDILLLEYS